MTGETVDIIQEGDSWWLAENKSHRRGFIPATYVSKIQVPPAIIFQKSDPASGKRQKASSSKLTPSVESLKSSNGTQATTLMSLAGPLSEAPIAKVMAVLGESSNPPDKTSAETDKEPGDGSALRSRAAIAPRKRRKPTPKKFVELETSEEAAPVVIIQPIDAKPKANTSVESSSETKPKRITSLGSALKKASDLKIFRKSPKQKMFHRQSGDSQEEKPVDLQATMKEATAAAAGQRKSERPRKLSDNEKRQLKQLMDDPESVENSETPVMASDIIKQSEFPRPSSTKVPVRSWSPAVPAGKSNAMTRENATKWNEAQELPSTRTSEDLRCSLQGEETKRRDLEIRMVAIEQNNRRLQRLLDEAENREKSLRAEMSVMRADLQAANEAKTALQGVETDHKASLQQLRGLQSMVDGFRQAEEDRQQRETADLEALRKAKADAELLAAQAKEARQEKDAALNRYQQECVLRKKFSSMVSDLKGKVRVICRVRPITSQETDAGCTLAVEHHGNEDRVQVDLMNMQAPREFTFDGVFGPTSSQDDLFSSCQDLVQSVLDGFNVCIFAYGQTGSGKTYTMVGEHGSPGIIPRAAELLFQQIETLQGHRHTVRVKTSMLELYNDTLVDLYRFDYQTVGPSRLEIHMDAKGSVYVTNATIHDANSCTDVLDLFGRGNANRHTGSTNMNAKSSRSHMIFSLHVEVLDETTGQLRSAKLSLIDLAGSERADKTGAMGNQLKESQSINLSLSALGAVVSALTTKSKFIPCKPSA